MSLTRLENYCVVYLATLESRDVICANWRETSVRVRSCAILSSQVLPDPAFLARFASGDAVSIGGHDRVVSREGYGQSR